MVSIDVDRERLIIRIKGIRRVLTLTKDLTIPLRNVRGATVDPEIAVEYPNALQKRIGTNVYQTYYGGTFVQDGDRVFWDIRDPKKAIVVTLIGEEFDRLIVEADDPTLTVRRIEAALVTMAKLDVC